MIKSLAKAILTSPPVRWGIKAALVAGRHISDIVSYAKFRALVPAAGRSVCHWSTEINHPENLRLGSDVIIGQRCRIGASASIFLGDNVRISPWVVIETASLDFSKPAPYKHVSRPIILERDVWVGMGAMVLSGVTIGEGSIIGAGTVVRHDVPAFSIVTSQPARTKPRTDGSALSVPEPSAT